MNVHYIGQVLDADFEDSVAFYSELGLDLRETTTGPVRVAFFETDTAAFHLIVREERGSPADELLDTTGRYSGAHVAFAVDDLAVAMAMPNNWESPFSGSHPRRDWGRTDGRSSRRPITWGSSSSSPNRIEDGEIAH